MKNQEQLQRINGKLIEIDDKLNRETFHISGGSGNIAQQYNYNQTINNNADNTVEIEIIFFDMFWPSPPEQIKIIEKIKLAINSKIEFIYFFENKELDSNYYKKESLDYFQDSLIHFVKKQIKKNNKKPINDFYNKIHEFFEKLANEICFNIENRDKYFKEQFHNYFENLTTVDDVTNNKKFFKFLKKIKISKYVFFNHVEFEPETIEEFLKLNLESVQEKNDNCISNYEEYWKLLIDYYNKKSFFVEFVDSFDLGVK